MDVVLAAGGARWEAATIREIEDSAGLRLVRRCVDVADLLAVAGTGLATAALVSADLVGLDADTVHRLERDGIRVAAIESDQEECRALGINRIARLGHLADLARDRRSVPPPTDESRAPLVAVWGPAGSPGRSTLALSLAAAAAAQGIDTILVDADTYGGSLGQSLSVLDDVSGLVAACRAANTGRFMEVKDHLLVIDDRLRLLTGLPRADMWPQVRTGALDLVLGRLRASADLLVVDCGFSLEPGNRNQTTLQVLEESDHVVVVGRSEPVGLARLVRGLHELGETLPGRVPTLVLNQARSSLGWREREVDATLHRLAGIAPSVHLPFDQAALDLAAVSGRTPREVSPSSPFVARIEVLARTLVSQVGNTPILAPSTT
ncbi:chromosome partitioning protein [Aeromicrobium sp. A1-2]|uniref:AAA family ATPase n=1 Tax=Aeromicrobium sp. A1-2 TaxID=2107713 RepID=UPI000E4CFC31|nr:chromosome partitioning protein [Aeromicrobium sp. A1-2]AXT85707.1 chromosome partitioning protein [Aeromicrobium sp. A1-2]